MIHYCTPPPPCIYYNPKIIPTVHALLCFVHDDVIKWKHFPRYWPFVRGIHRSPVNFPHKGQWRGALMFTLICARINGWVNTREAGDLRRYRPHYDVIVMLKVVVGWFYLYRHSRLLRGCWGSIRLPPRCSDVIMSPMASPITSFTIVYSTVYSRRRSNKTSKLCVTGLCAGNSPVTSEIPTQWTSNAENVSIWSRHHAVPVSDPEGYGPINDMDPSENSRRENKAKQNHVYLSRDISCICYWWNWISCLTFHWNFVWWIFNCLEVNKQIGNKDGEFYMGQDTELWLSCYLVLLSTDSKTR